MHRTRSITRFVAAFLLLLIALGWIAADTSARSRIFGPSGQVPPTGRIPPLPPPGTGPGTGASIAGPMRVSGPPATPSGSLRPTGAGQRSTAGRKRKGKSAPNYSTWEFWWTYNEARFVNRDQRRGEGAQGTLSLQDWALGSREPGRMRDTERPGPRSVREELVPVLIGQLADPYFDVRASAALALGKTGVASVLPDVTGMLADPRLEVSESAALALGLLGEPAAASVLRHLLNDTSEGRRAAARTTGVPYRIRSFAAVALGLLGDEAAVPDLLRYLESSASLPSEDIPVCSAVGLGLIGAKAVAALPRLVALVENRRHDELVRAHALSAYGKIAGASSRSWLFRLLRDESAHVRRSAVLALAEVGGEADPKAVEYVAAYGLPSSDPQMRNWSLITLANLGGDQAAKLLERTAVHGTGSDRAFGALGLALLARSAERPEIAAATLRRGLAQAKDSSTRGAFCIALGLIGDRHSAAALETLVASRQDATLRGHAAMALGMMSAVDTLPTIQAAFADASHSAVLRRNCGMALGLLGDRSVVSSMTAAIRETNVPAVQAAAVLALGLIADRTAIPALTAMVNDREHAADSVRSSAGVALGMIAEEGSRSALRRVAEGTNYRALVESLYELLRVY